jgi:fatty-acyl-CoA synthase
MSNGWNFAELWERVARKFPDAPCLIHGDLVRSWTEVDQRANGLARFFLDAGLKHQDKVALYLYNGPEYMETAYACYKASLVPVNTNYRYVENELAYLWDNADAVAVVFHASFTDVVDRVRSRVPGVTTWVWVDDDGSDCPEWATPYEQAATPTAEATVSAEGRSGDDLLMIYTGGTTGMPKGVMWRQDDLIRATCTTGAPALLEDPENVGGPDAIVDAIAAPGAPGLPACPLMHGTGWFTANIFWVQGGSIVTLQHHHFDADELLDTIERHRVGALTIVGDAFSRPILAALDAAPGKRDLSSLVLVTSSGVMWSEPIKERLLEHNPGMLLIDVFSSSEAIGLGQSVSAKGVEAQTARFALGPNARVVREDGTDVEPGSGERGRVAVRGFTPIGYYKDEEKTAATFLTFEGKRYSIPGDWATVDDDGTINLLGRGSVCINTGGEKVFPEEVEEVLKLHDGIDDAVVVGVPDDKFGEAIIAVVQPVPGATVDAAAVVAHCKHELAHFKAPKQLLVVDSIGRAPNAKVDYARWKTYAREQLGLA